MSTGTGLYLMQGDESNATGVYFMDYDSSYASTSGSASKIKAGFGVITTGGDVENGHMFAAIGSNPWSSSAGLFITTNNIAWKDYDLIHAGNISSQSVNYAATANMSYYLNNLTVTNGSDLGVNLTSNAIGYVNTGANLLNQIDGGIIKQYFSSNWGFDLYMDYRSGHMMSRGLNDGTYTNWKRVGNTYGIVSGTTLTLYID